MACMGGKLRDLKEDLCVCVCANAFRERIYDLILLRKSIEHGAQMWDPILVLILVPL